MSTAVREARTAVMIRVEVSWEDASGNFRSLSARMEDKSLSGACIRVKTPIDVGSKVRVQWRFEQFSGVVKYCRLEDWDYLVGMQREGTYGALASPEARVEAEPTEKTKEHPPETVERKQTNGAQTVGTQTVGTQTMVRSSVQTNVPRLPEAQGITAGKVLPVDNHLVKEPGSEVRTTVRVRGQARQLPKERKSMARKWLGLTPWLKQDGVSVAGAESKADSEGKSEKESFVPDVIPSAIKAADERAVESVAGFQVELLPVEDVYGAAGMTNPQKGYSIHKVVEMLNSEHLGGLSKEMRRAAVLMALDAAGVSIEDVQRDAKARQDALNGYEAEQKKQVEAEWARKAQENILTREELERVKAGYMARINRNLDGVAREKAALESWMTVKQQEIANIAEVVDLCVKPQALEPVSSPLAKAAGAGALGAGVSKF